MDGVREFLEAIRDGGLVAGHFRGLLHIAIGRRVTRPDGTVVSSGVTWRELAGLLKLLRFDKELVREYGADPETLAPRDRHRFWYVAIAQARVDAPEAVAEAERLASRLKTLGYVVSANPSPTSGTVSAPPATPTASLPATKAKPPAPKAKDKEPKRKKKG